MPNMQTATLITVDGQVTEVRPKDGKEFSLEELQDYVQGLIEYVPLPDGRNMIVNETGKLDGLPPNPKAIEIWKEVYPIEEYPHNNDELIVGDVLILPKEEEVCEHCGGEGVVLVNAPVYQGEPHMAPIDQEPCVCQAREE